MKSILIIFLILVFFQSCKQTKTDYLKNNRFDLNATDFKFPQNDFKIIGFGAYHGSAKTEDVELELISALTSQNAIKYYLPETDYSIAHFFNQYLKTGDTLLLKDLVKHYGSRVPQDRSIETYNKWKKLKLIDDALPDEKKLEVLGIDLLVSYKYTTKHIIELVDSAKVSSEPFESLKNMIVVDTTDYSILYDSYSKTVLRAFVNDFEQNKTLYYSAITKQEDFDHIINNIKITFKNFDKEREPAIYGNYLTLKKRYKFESNPQFLRMGFSHLMKSREGNDGYPYFFTRLIENTIYPKEQVISVIGYLTNSEVVWDELYDDKGDYTGYTKEAGFGIGDYEKEYFKGIQNLKDTKLSDKTLFRLNNSDTFFSDNQPHLIEVVMSDEASNGDAVKGMSTTDFLDYAILISDSEASRPIYEMQ